MISVSQRLFDLFCCRKENPAVRDLIQKYPAIDSAFIVNPYLKRRLGQSELDALEGRLALESDLREELGPDVYRDLLGGVQSAALTTFASNESAFGRFIDRVSEGNPPNVNGLSLREKALMPYRVVNQRAFREEAQRRYPRVSADVMQRVAGQCFPRFAEGHQPVAEDDWAKLRAPLIAYNRRIETPQERVVYDRYTQGMRRIDFLERERSSAVCANSREAVRELTREIEDEARQMSREPAYPRQIQALQFDRDAGEHVCRTRYTVFKVGDILCNEGGKSGKFGIIDWTDVPPNERRRVEPTLDYCRLAEKLETVNPGEPIHFDGARLFYETSESVMSTLQDLDFNQGSYLQRKSLADTLKFAPWAKELKIGDYKRVPKRTDANTAEARERTSAIDRKEAILLIGQLRSMIMEGKASELNWNAYLRIKDYVDTIKAHPDHLNDPQFALAMEEFAKISTSLEGLIKGRVLLAHLESTYASRAAGDSKRKYDIAIGAKQTGEIARVFQDWIRAIDMFLKEIGADGKLQADYRWFEEELRRILPAIRTFSASLPQELVAIDRMTPDEIRVRYSQNQLEEIIGNALTCLNSPFYQSFPTLLFRLQIAQTGKTFVDATDTLEKRHQKNQRFLSAARLALPNAFQIPTRVAACIEGLAKAMSKPSALQWKILKAYERVKKTALEAEKMRVAEARRLLVGQSKKDALNYFYPTV